MRDNNYPDIIKASVAICGSHGCGKTTIADCLNPINRIDEIARKVIEEMGKTPQLMDTHEREIFERAILSEQLDKEEYWRIDEGGFLSDRSVLDVLAYSYYLIGDGEAYNSLKEIAKRAPRYDFLFYTPIEFPLVSDGVRFEGDEFQKQIDEKIKELAKEFNYELIPLTGTVEERVGKLLSVISQ